MKKNRNGFFRKMVCVLLVISLVAPSVMTDLSKSYAADTQGISSEQTIDTEKQEQQTVTDTDSQKEDSKNSGEAVPDGDQESANKSEESAGGEAEPVDSENTDAVKEASVNVTNRTDEIMISAEELVFTTTDGASKSIAAANGGCTLDASGLDAAVLSGFDLILKMDFLKGAGSRKVKEGDTFGFTLPGGALQAKASSGIKMTAADGTTVADVEVSGNSVRGTFTEGVESVTSYANLHIKGNLVKVKLAEDSTTQASFDVQSGRTVTVILPAYENLKAKKSQRMLNDVSLMSEGAMTSILGQIHWNDTANDWNELTRPKTRPADPNTYINLWQYVSDGETSTEPQQLTLQSDNPAAPYYCVITPTEGIDYWTYSIVNVPDGDNYHFYTTGPAFTSYKETGRAVEKEDQSGNMTDSIKLEYIEYELNYQPLTVKPVMIPSSDTTGRVNVTVKVGAAGQEPDSAAVNYGGAYTLTRADASESTGNATGGTVSGIGNGDELVLTEIPEGLTYKVTETGNTKYIVAYDSNAKGVIGEQGAETVITNVSNDAKAEFTKVWNDNMDEGRSESAFVDALTTEYSLDGGATWAELDSDACDELAIEGVMDYRIDKNGSNWKVNATHGNSAAFPAAKHDEENDTYTEILYRITEGDITGYIRTIDESDAAEPVIENTKSESFNAKLYWKDIDDKQDRPSKAAFKLVAYYVDEQGKRHILTGDQMAAYGIESKFEVDVDTDTDSEDINITGLPLYTSLTPFGDEPAGAMLNYYIQEDKDSIGENYTVTYDNRGTAFVTNSTACYNGGSITNLRTEPTDFTMTKIWQDGVNTGSRPNAKIYLYRYTEGQNPDEAEPVAIRTPTGGSWVVSKELDDDMAQTRVDIDFAEIMQTRNVTMQKYDLEGREYIYLAKEVLTDKEDGSNSKYYKLYSNEGEYEDCTTAVYDGGTLYNSNIPQVDISVSKTWKSAAVPDNINGTSVTMQIMYSEGDDDNWQVYRDKDGDAVEVTLSGFTESNTKISKTVTLPQCDQNGNIYKYKLQEKAVAAGDGTDLMAGADEDVTCEINGYSYVFSSEVADMADAEANADDPDANLTASLEGLNTLTGKTNCKVNKFWSGITPDENYSATAHLIRYTYDGSRDNSFNGNDYPVTLDNTNSFTETVYDLPLYDSEGYRFVYSAVEDGYTAPETDDEWFSYYNPYYDKNTNTAIVDITNYHKGDKTITIEKKWVDDGDVEARKPVTAQVYDANGDLWEGKTVTVSERSNWTGNISFSDDELEKLEEGITVEEVSVGGNNVVYDGTDSVYPEYKSDDHTLGLVRSGDNGYIYKVENNSQAGNDYYTITNTRVGKATLKINKTWIDGSRDNEERPGFGITVLKNGTNWKTVNIDKDTADADGDNWEFSIANLDKYDENGKLIKYEVSEVNSEQLRADDYKYTLEEGDYDPAGEISHSGGIYNYNLVNKREAETKYTVYKIWSDPKETTRRPGISATLYYSLDDGETLYRYGAGPLAEWQQETIDYIWDNGSDDDPHNMKCTVNNLAKYSPEDGTEIKYYSCENMNNRGDYVTYGWEDAGRTKAIDEKDGQIFAADGQYFENRMQAQFDLKGVKTWSNLQKGTKVGDIDTKRVHILLYRYSGSEEPEDFADNPEKYQIDQLVLGTSSQDGKNFEFDGLDKYDGDGEKYTYLMSEYMEGSLGYVFTMDPSGFTLNNTFVTGEKNNRKIVVHKNWNSDAYTTELAAGQTDFRYPDVTYMLYRSSGLTEANNKIDFNADPYATVTLKTDQGETEGEAVFDKQLIWSENGVQYKYAVVEKIGDNVLPGYTIETDKKKVEIVDDETFTPENMPADKIATFGNTYVPENDFQLEGDKVWKDHNSDSLRPDDLTLSVYRKAVRTSDSYAITEEKLTEGRDYSVTWEKNGDTWSYTIEGAAISEYSPGGQPWVYRIAEDADDNPDIAEYYDCSGDAVQTGTAAGGVRKMSTITNSLNGTYTVAKVWDDNNNEYALRPTRVIVGLQRSIDGADWEYVTEANDSNSTQLYSYTPVGSDTAYSVLACELSYSKNKWQYKFDTLPKADENGNLYHYRGVELAVGDANNITSTRVITNEKNAEETRAGSYTASYDISDSKTTVTNKLDPTKLTITKTWSDYNDVYDTRPKNASKVPQITVKLQRALQDDFQNNPDSETIWQDVTNTSGKVVTKTYQTTTNNGAWAMENLPKCNMSGDLYLYRAVEITDDVTENYTTTYKNDSMNFTEITNTIIERDVTEINATKTWRDGTATTHPEVEFELTRWNGDVRVAYPQRMIIKLDGTVDDGEAVYGEKAAWKATWSHLPKYDNEGNEWTYKVEEISVDGKTVTNGKTTDYLVSDGITTAAAADLNFANTESMSYKVTKKFTGDDNAHRPTQVTVELQRKIDGGDWEDVESRDIKGFTNDAEKKVAELDTTFVDLPKYNEDNDPYIYRAIETKIGDQTVGTDKFAAGYDVTETPNAENSQTDIVNDKRTVSFTGLKTWDDQSDYYKLRPEDVTVKVYTGTDTANTLLDKQPEHNWTKKDGNKWYFTYSDMPQYDNKGNIISYFVKETSTVNGYDKTNNQLGNTSGFAAAQDGDTVALSNGSDTNGIVNKLQTVDVEGTKTWVETVNGTGYNNRPADLSSITIKLLDNGKTGTDKTVSVPSTSFEWTDNTGDDNTWKYKFSDVPKTDSTGRVITYTISEENAGNYGYAVKYDTSTLNPTNTIEKTSVTAKKVWDDQNDLYGTRPEDWDDTTGNGLFEVYADIGDDNGPVKMANQPTCSWTKTADSNGVENWTFKAENLQKYYVDADGAKQEIAYTVQEKTMPKNYTAQTSTEGNVTTITNTLKVTNVSGTKTWAETVNGSAPNNRPAGVTLVLKGNGTEKEDAQDSLTWDKTGKNVWKYTFANVPEVDADGETITYTVEETGAAAAGYTESYTGNNITNTIDKTSVTATKIWDDQSNAYGTRPAEGVWNAEDGTGLFKVYADNTLMATQPECTWTKVNDNEYTFKAENLQKYRIDEKGKKQEIEYTVKEPTVPSNYNLTTSADGSTMTNTLKVTDISGTKTWVETVNGSAPSNRPAGVTLVLKGNGNKVEVPEGTLNWTNKDTDEWTYTYSDLPQVDAAGRTITYTVEETGAGAAGYTESYNGNNITNTIDKVTVTAKKDWNDQEDKYGTRPEGWDDEDGTGIFKVYADDVIMADQPECSWTKTATSNGIETWTFKAENLQKYRVDDKGKKQEIEYTVKEPTVPANYTAQTSTVNDVTVIKNSLRETEFSGSKIWQDNSNAYGTRPAALTLTLERKIDGGEWETTPGNPAVTWSNNDNNHNTWKYSYTGLPEKDLNGSDYTYRVQETVPTGYHTATTTALDKGTLTNTFDYGTLTMDKVFGEQKDNGTADRPIATFTITSKDKTRTFVTKTDKNGKLVQADDGSYTDVNSNKFWLIPGEYTIKETAADKATDGCTFATDKTSYTFNIEKDGSTASVSNDDTGKFVNAPVRGAMTVLKFDEKYIYKDGTLKERKNNKEMLADAEFNLCLDKAGTKVITKLVTTEDTGVYGLPQTADGAVKTNELGISYIREGKLLCGTYWIVETTNPEGYYTKESQSPQKVEVVTAAGTETVTDIPVDVANTMIEKQFRISKTYEVANLNAYDGNDAKIAEGGTMTVANNSNHQFSFTIERKNTSKPAFAYKVTKTTDADGIADFGNIPYGTYTVTETASSPYVTPQIKEITVDAEGVHQDGQVLTDGTTAVENHLKRGSMEGKKLGYSTQEENTVPVKDAVMGLFADDTCLATTITDENGHYSFTDIPYGNYYVREVKAPEYYNLAETTRAVNITEEGQNIDITGNPIVDAPAIMDLHLHKIQNEFGGEAMKDVTFKLKGDDFLNNGVTREEITDEDGNLTMTKLPVGEYTLTEVKVDDFEEPDIYNVKITNRVVGNSNEGSMTMTKISGTETSEVTEEDGVFTIENTRIRRDFSFNKVGTDDEIDLQHASPLAGAEFKLYDNEKCEGDAFTDNKCVGIATGDENGEVAFSDIPCGTWYIKESQAPTNFTLDENVYKVEVTQDGEVVSEFTRTVNEAIRGEITLTKVDSEDPSHKLAGSTYKLYRFNSETGEYEELMTGKTDKNGQVTFSNLLIGPKYRIQEFAASEGYQVSKKPIEFEMVLQDDRAVVKILNTGDSTITVDEDGNITWNEPPTWVEITKRDKKGRELAGADFEIKDKNGKVVESWTSEGTAHVVSGLLTAGETYSLVETKAPDGYVTADPVTFTVEKREVGPDKLYCQKVTMKDESTEIKIQKTNSDGRALKGATFELKGDFADGSDTKKLALDSKSSCKLKELLIEGKKYKLTEIKAPLGYVEMKGNIVFRLNENNEIELIKYDHELVSISSDKVKDKDVYTIQIKNEKTAGDNGEGHQGDGGSATRTGDDMHILLYMLLMLEALLIIAVLVRKRRMSGEE